MKKFFIIFVSALLLCSCARERSWEITYCKDYWHDNVTTVVAEGDHIHYNLSGIKVYRHRINVRAQEVYTKVISYKELSKDGNSSKENSNKDK